MVVKGDFSVRIVEAASKHKFQEHTAPDGKIYAEVEPEAEYYIEIEILSGNPQQYKYCELHVDGTKLGYHKKLTTASGKNYSGLWTQDENTSTTRAFRFEKPRIQMSEDAASSSSNRGGLMGNVEVHFYDAVFMGYTEPTKTIYKGEKKPLVASSVMAQNQGQTKKALRTGKGEHSESKAVSSAQRVARYDKGAFIDSITVHYCTALGLIKAGVLPRPEDYFAEARMAAPWKRPTEGPAPLDGVSAKRKKKEAVFENGKMVEAPKELELYDLSAFSDDEDF